MSFDNRGIDRFDCCCRCCCCRRSEARFFEDLPLPLLPFFLSLPLVVVALRFRDTAFSTIEAPPPSLLPPFSTIAVVVVAGVAVAACDEVDEFFPCRRRDDDDDEPSSAVTIDDDDDFAVFVVRAVVGFSTTENSNVFEPTAAVDVVARVFVVSTDDATDPSPR